MSALRSGKNRITAKWSRETRSSAKIKNRGAMVTEAELCCVGWEGALRLGCKFQVASSFPSIMLSVLCFGFGDLTCASETDEPTFLANLQMANSNSSGQKGLFYTNFFELI